MTCSDCGENLDEVPVGEPCPGCGGTRRDARVTVTSVAAVTSVMPVTIEVGYAPVRPWAQKWRDVLHQLDKIEQAYTGGDTGNEQVRRDVEEFFKVCRELADWLERNAGSPTAQNFVNTDGDLKFCNAMAQTTKHHTRHNGITARITSVRTGPGGVRVEITWSDSTTNGIDDARDLARRCVAAWQGFFAQHNLTP